MGLSKSTSFTQGQDKLYKYFKGKCRAMNDEVFTSKLKERIQAIKDLNEELLVLSFKKIGVNVMIL